MPMRIGVVVLWVALVAVPAGGEIYRWTDTDGRVHFTQDLTQVPPDQRAAARDAASQGSPARIQRYESAPDTTARAPRRRPGSEMRIPFQRRGTLMQVDVLVNDHVHAPFLIDTGASSIAIPQALADELGIQIGPDTPRQPVQTANGIVAEPVVRLDAVELGGARVEGMRAFVSGSMDIGLLGGSFFNNFVYSVDAAAGEITLTPNDRVRGGMSEPQWRDRFRALRGALERVETYRQENHSADRNRQLEERAAQIAQALDALEQEANRAQVPQTWRE